MSRCLLPCNQYGHKEHGLFPHHLSQRFLLVRESKRLIILGWSFLAGQKHPASHSDVVELVLSSQITSSLAPLGELPGTEKKGRGSKAWKWKIWDVHFRITLSVWFWAIFIAVSALQGHWLQRPAPKLKIYLVTWTIVNQFMLHCHLQQKAIG